ncbi:MAG: non-ribosomal peptide synthetase [Verrucomicrobiota bacterium]
MAETCPSAIALVHNNGSWSYQQLERGSRALALEILSRAAPNEVVAIVALRSPELVLGMLACLRAGLTFTVLDPSYPEERRKQLRALASPGRLLTFHCAAAENLMGTETPAVDSSAAVTAPVCFHFEKDRVEALLESDSLPTPNIDAVNADEIAYLLFTSGTTGSPKCIKTSHHPLVHFVGWYAKAFPVDSTCRFSMLSGVGHDPVLRDIFIPLSFGAELHIPPTGALQDPPALYTWLMEAAVSHMHITPQMGRILCSGRRGREALRELRFILSGGDMLRRKLVFELHEVAPLAKVVNFYGATETPQAMGFHLFDPNKDGGDNIVPIGKGIDDAQLLVLDDMLRPVEIGVRGQIAIRTKFLSGGYVADSNSTAANFVPHPDNRDPADLFYLTGDVGHFREDGAVVLDGRNDDQVKIRGYRVELAEVVRHLECIPSVGAAVVLSDAATDGENRLTAYVVDARGMPSDGVAAAAQIRQELARTLPAYMVPFQIIVLESLPLLPNGKVDRNRLRLCDPPASQNTTQRPSPSQSDSLVEIAIIAAWSTLLERKTIDVQSNFFELGGDSLSTITAAMQLEDILGVLPEHWEKLSISELARQKLERRTTVTRIDTAVFIRAASIVAIVAAHFDFPNMAGSVRTLFVISGVSLGKYLIGSVLRTDRVDAILKLAFKIALPTVLYTVFLDITLFRQFKWQAVFLLNNVLQPDYPDGGYSFWFVIVLVQSLLLLAGLLTFKQVRAVVRAQPFKFAWCGTLLMAGVAAATHIGSRRLFHDHLPTVYLGAILLGWTTVLADTASRRLLVIAAMLATFIEPALRSQNEEFLIAPFIATVCLLYIRQITIPERVGRIVKLIAASSLFTYLTDKQVKSLADLTPLVNHPWLTLVLAFLTGIAVWKAWETALNLVSRLYRLRTRTRAQSEASVPALSSTEAPDPG